MQIIYMLKKLFQYKIWDIINLATIAIAPYQDIRFLIYPQDLPKHEKKNSSQIDYIPDFVLEQLFEHINDLHKDLIPVVWIAFKTIQNLGYNQFGYYFSFRV
jgi:hypothetical protein